MNTEQFFKVFILLTSSQLFGHPDPLDPPVTISIYRFEHRLSQHMHAVCYVSALDVSIYILTQEGFSCVHAWRIPISQYFVSI